MRSIARAGAVGVALGCAVGACSLDDRELDVVDTGLLPPDAEGQGSTGGREAIIHTGAAILDVVTDADGVFFSEVGVGLRHLPLDSDSPSLTTLAPSSYALLELASDESSV